MSDVKTLHKAAFALESAAAWGSGANTVIGEKMFPFLEFSPQKTINHEQNNSIYSDGFKETPRVVTNYLEASFSHYQWFQGPLKDIAFWAFGYELPPVPVVVVTADDLTTEPQQGTVYENGAGASFVFLRKEEYRDETLYVFVSEKKALPGSTLTQVSGAGPDEIAVSTSSSIMYEHLFELDKDSRHVCPYKELQRPLEVVYITANLTNVPAEGDVYQDDENSFQFVYAGANGSKHRFILKIGSPIIEGDLSRVSGEGDEIISPDTVDPFKYEVGLDFQELGIGDKCRRATLHFGTEVSDQRLRNCVCKRFALHSEASKFWEVTNEFLGYDCEKGTYFLGGESFPTATLDASNIIAHHQTQVLLGPKGSEVSVGITSLDVGVEIPLEVGQDTLSSVYLKEPIFNGKYDISFNAILSRYSSDVFQEYRDNWTDLIGVVRAKEGFFSAGYYFNALKEAEASLDDSEVTKQNLNLIPYYDSDNNLEAYFPSDYFPQQMKSPVLYMVRDNDPYYTMIER